MIPFGSANRKANKEFWERHRIIREMVKVDAGPYYHWTPEFCPLREHGRAGVTVMYEPPDNRIIMPSEKPRAKAARKKKAGSGAKES